MRAEELIYAGIDPRQVGRLQAFRERSERISDVVDKLLYRAWSLGEGDTATVFLPGGMAHGEVWFPQMLHLRGVCRSVTFSLPESKSMEQVADGVAAALEHMGIRRCVVAGYSLGGLVAQVMARRHPKLVAGMALVLTGAPAAGLPANICAKWIARRGMVLRSRLMNFNNPTRMGMAESAFRANCPPEKAGELEFWRAFIEDTYCNYMYKNQFINLNYIALPKLYNPPTFRTEDMQDWPGKVLILESSGDTLYEPEERAALRALYPAARVSDLGDEGQFSMLIHEERVSQELEVFYQDCLGNAQNDR